VGLGTFLQQWRDSRSGGVALISAFAIPPIALLVCGAIDFASVVSDKGAFQNVADATALQAALQIGVSDPVGISARDDEFARKQLSELSSRTTYSVATDIASDNSSVTVTISGVRTSFFINMLPPGGWRLAGRAKAASLARTPLCVLSSGQDSLSSIKMDGTSLLTAADCLIQSNQDIAATQSAWMKAQVIQSSGLASGNLSPTPQAGAPAIADPFTNLDLNQPAGLNLTDPLGIVCLPLDQILAAGLHTLAPGVHCGNIQVAKDTTLVLQPGEHYFLKSKLQLKSNAVISGDDVVLVFDDKSQFQFQDNAQVSLSGRKSGPLAGFVVATTRKNTSTFEISSDSARKLLGTIYIPSAKLLVTGGNDKVADQSAWTVIVAKAIEMHGGPNLVVNANYAGSTVPVPHGVGPGAEGARLVR
jgi:hypothetical protein